MNKSGWALMTPVEEKEYEKRGYALLKEDVIKCADCGRTLLDIIKVKEGDIIKELEAICPCGGSSFIYRIVGESYFQACPGLSIEDIDMDFEDEVTTMKVKVVE